MNEHPLVIDTQKRLKVFMAMRKTSNDLLDFQRRKHTYDAVSTVKPDGPED